MDMPKEEVVKYKHTSHWIFFLRQLFSCSVTVFYFFICGMYQGSPTVIAPQMRREANSTDAVSTEMASWLSSILSYSAIPWTIILPLLGYRYGRKILLVLVSFVTLLGNILFYCSTSPMELLFSMAVQGMVLASLTTVAIMVLSEYTSPKNRGIILIFKAATYFWGIWISNAVGTFFHWRHIGTVVFVCCIYNLLSIFSCESPYWLATKGKFDECAKIHRWLKGTDENSEEELRKLILSQKELLNLKANLKRQKGRNFLKIFNIVRRRSFYKPLVFSLLSACLYIFSGKVVYTVYAIDIIKKITSSEKMAYNAMLILDGVTVIGMYAGCALAKFIGRRTQLLLLSSVGVCFLYVLSIYLYMVHLNVISEDKYVSLFLLTGFSLAISCGPMSLSACCSAEVSPLSHRSYFLSCVAILCNSLFGTMLKITPNVFKFFGTHGAFLFYAISANIFILILYKYLPETKDKTIQEIQCIIAGEDCHAASYKVESELVPLEGPKNT